MDPDEALDRARIALSAFLAADSQHLKEKALEAASDLADAFEALDQWMTSGGFPPAGWARRA